MIVRVSANMLRMGISISDAPPRNGVDATYTSRFRTCRAWDWMNSRRGATASPHEGREGVLGVHEVLDLHLEHDPGVGVHGGVPELVGVHLPQSLVALELEAPASLELPGQAVLFLLGVGVDGVCGRSGPR